MSIFLNLSAIPDDCVKGLQISDEDYSTNLNEQMADFTKKNPMKSFGRSGLDTWLKLFDDFLDQRDKEYYDEAAAERARTKKR